MTGTGRSFSIAPAWGFSSGLGRLVDAIKRRVRQKKVLVLLGAVLLAVLATGVVVASRSQGGPSSGPLTGSPVTARFPQYRFSLRYPSGWIRVSWECQVFSILSPIALLTNSRPAPRCPGPTFQGGVSFPPRERIAANGVSLALAMGGTFPGEKKVRWNARIAGQPARITRVQAPLTGCPTGVPNEFRTFLIGGRHALLDINATMCGPDLGGDNAAIQRILNSLHFTT